MFKLGRVVYTKGIAIKIENQNFSNQDILQVLCRHSSGDWGDLSQEDMVANDFAVKHNERLLSSYSISNIKIWVITEWNREATTILLPEEY